MAAILCKLSYVSERSGNIILASCIILNFAGKTHRDSRSLLFNIRVLYFMRASSETFAESEPLGSLLSALGLHPLSSSLPDLRFPF